MAVMARRRNPLPDDKSNPWPAVLFALRERMDWDQSQAAKALGTTRNSWNRWENGEVIPAGMIATAIRCFVKERAPRLAKKLPE